MGIGINSEMMNVGNMGSKYRITYTVVGDAVNLASRLEELTRNYRVPTIVSETTMKDCNNILFRALDVVQVKGKRNKTRIFEPICKASDADDILRKKLNIHEQAMNYYFEENWGQAQKLIEQLNRDYKTDQLYQIMLDKIVSKSV